MKRKLTKAERAAARAWDRTMDGDLKPVQRVTGKAKKKKKSS